MRHVDPIAVPASARVRMTAGRRIALASVAATAVLGIAGAMPLDGVVHGGPWRLLGRLHPLVVHFPIALLFLVPLLEGAGRKRPALRDAAGFLLGLAVPAGIAAVAAGLALARADGHEGALVSNHSRGGILVALGTILAWALRGRTRAGYTVVLAATLLVLAWAAHHGGSLTHGSTYLTDALPPTLRRALHLSEPVTPEAFAPDSVFASAVQPVLERHCLACHGPERQKGDYRMDTFAALLAGGKSGHPAIAPGKPDEGELLRRLLLPIDDDKVMPPRKKPRPRADEIALLSWWIRQGAPRDLKVAAVTRAPADVTRLLHGAVGPSAEKPESASVPRVGDYAALRPEIARLQKDLGIQLIPISQRPGDGLILRTRAATATFGDAELARLAPIARFVVEAELARTRVTDAAIPTLGQFTALARLHLEHTAIAGTSLETLAKLEGLEYLNLCFTATDDAAVARLPPLPALRRLFLFGSRVTPAGLQSLRARLPHCEIGAVENPPDAPSSVENRKAN